MLNAVVMFSVTLVGLWSVYGEQRLSIWLQKVLNNAPALMVAVYIISDYYA